MVSLVPWLKIQNGADLPAITVHELQHISVRNESTGLFNTMTEVGNYTRPLTIQTNGKTLSI